MKVALLTLLSTAFGAYNAADKLLSLKLVPVLAELQDGSVVPLDENLVPILTQVQAAQYNFTMQV
jgi:hypothetical protein